MTRLFLRFYLGVLFILLCAWWIQAFVMRQRSEAANVRVVEEALGGGVRLACERLADAAPADRDSALAAVQHSFDYPVLLITLEDVPDYARERFSRGDRVVLIGRENLGFVVALLADGTGALQFGPLPAFIGPSQTDWVTGLGLVLLLAAAAIAVLLRPVAKQLRLVERAATAIAGGDLSARVDERKTTSARTLASAFNNMAERTETLLRAQRELLQAISHELRTPLSRIHFAIDLTRQAADERQRDARLDSLEHAADELDDLVGELLRYVRLETGEPKLDLTTSALLPMVNELIERHALVNPTISLQMDDAIRENRIAIHADIGGLERALGNLLANAGRFAQSKVVIRAEETSQGTVVDVDDDGPGIVEADRRRVFEPFVRLDESSRGAGLGLALVRRIVANHGGSVVVLDSPLGGCRFRSIWPGTSAGKDRTGTGNDA